ncbi:MAG: tail fiber domain-containing protein, partial [bacterium]
YAAGDYNYGGSYNSFLGNYAGYYNNGGSYNNFIGYRAGYGNFSYPNYYNNFIGSYAGYRITSGSYNNFLGNYAGYSNTTGQRNNFIGYSAGYSNATGSGNVFLGYQAGYSETGSDKLYIANSSANPPLIYGDFSTGSIGIGTNSIGGTNRLTVQGTQDTAVWAFNSSSDSVGALGYSISGDDRGVYGMDVDGVGVYGATGNGKAIYGIASDTVNGYAGYFAGKVQATEFLYDSDESLKTDIKEIDNALERVLSLEGVNFKWLDGDGEEEIGVIAQEVEKVAPELVETDPTTGLKSVKYGNITALLIEAIKEQQKEIESLKEMLNQ